MSDGSKLHRALILAGAAAAAIVALWPSAGAPAAPALAYLRAPAQQQTTQVGASFSRPVRVIIPPDPGTAIPATYTVQPGDNGLSVIAQKLWGHSSDWPVLYYANGSTTIISAGEVLKVPPLPKIIPAPPAPPAPPSPSPSATQDPQPTPTTQPAPQPTTGSGNTGALGACIRNAENGGSYAWGTGNGGGAYQFEPGTWASYAPSGAWGSASPAQQDAAFLAVVAAGPQAVYNAWEHGTDTCPSQFGMF